MKILWGVAVVGKGEESRVISLRKRRRRKKYSLIYEFFNSFIVFFKLDKKATIKNHIKKPVNH